MNYTKVLREREGLVHNPRLKAADFLPDYTGIQKYCACMLSDCMHWRSLNLLKCCTQTCSGLLITAGFACRIYPATFYKLYVSYKAKFKFLMFFWGYSISVLFIVNVFSLKLQGIEKIICVITKVTNCQKADQESLLSMEGGKKETMRNQ